MSTASGRHRRRRWPCAVGERARTGFQHDAHVRDRVARGISDAEHDWFGEFFSSYALLPGSADRGDGGGGAGEGSRAEEDGFDEPPIPDRGAEPLHLCGRTEHPRRSGIARRIGTRASRRDRPAVSRCPRHRYIGERPSAGVGQMHDNAIGQPRGDGSGLSVGASRGPRVGGDGFRFRDEDGGAVEAIDAGDEVLSSGEVAEPPGDAGSPVGIRGGGAGVAACCWCSIFRKRTSWPASARPRGHVSRTITGEGSTDPAAPS